MTQHHKEQKNTIWSIGIKKRSFGIGLVFASLYLFAVGSLKFFENRLLFHPLRYPQGNWNFHELAVEDAWFPSADGTLLHGWYIPQKDPLGVLLYLHGNRGNLTDWTKRVRVLHDRLKLSVMIFDYRGFGKSAGSPTEEGVLQDARAAQNWLAKRTGLGCSDILLLGHSLGGGIAVDLAAEKGARALILEGTFTSLPDVAALHYPWAPVRFIMKSRMDSLSKINRYHGPLFQSHGDADEVIPYEIGQKLFAAANEPKRFITIAGGHHEDVERSDYYDLLHHFITSLPNIVRFPRSVPGDFLGSVPPDFLKLYQAERSDASC